MRYFQLRLLPIGLVAALLPLHAADSLPEPVRAGPVRLSADLRLRWDAPFYEIDRDDHFVSTRVRLTAAADPMRWLGVTVQLQDTRVGAARDLAAAPALNNPFDVHLASAELRTSGPRRWTLRAGRQELPVGEERLIGADIDWCANGRSFDGVRLMHQRGPFDFDAFAATVVRLAPGFDRIDRTRRVAGVQVTWQIREGVLSAAPYHLRTARSDLGVRTDLHTSGVRVRARLPRAVTYTSETAVQTGRHDGAATLAWAGNWELSRGFGDPEQPGLRWFGGFVYASGGRGRTFDDLFPAVYNDCGVVEPFTWRNIAYPVAGVEVAVSRHVRLSTRYQAVWLADRKGGLFPDQGPAAMMPADPASARVGDLVSARATVRIDRVTELTAGVGRLFAGPYLIAAGRGSSVIPFVQLRFRR